MYYSPSHNSYSMACPQSHGGQTCSSPSHHQNHIPACCEEANWESGEGGRGSSPFPPQEKPRGGPEWQQGWGREWARSSALSQSTRQGHCCTPETYPNYGQQVTQSLLPLPSIRLASVLHPRELGTVSVWFLNVRQQVAKAHRVLHQDHLLPAMRHSLPRLPPAACMLPGLCEHCEYLGECQGAGCARSGTENGPVTGSIVTVTGWSTLPLSLAKMAKMAKREKYITVGDHPKVTV